MRHVTKMELDKKTLEIIIETRNDVKHILKALNHGAETFKDHTERIQELEKKQQLMKGKLNVITKLLTSIAAIVSGFIIYLWVHLVSRG